MGEVYRARDPRLDRFVAIKILSSEIDMAPRGRERFEREARAISKLSHPRICTVHDIGVAEIDGRDVPYLVMELLDGETLAARIARGPLPVDQALSYGIDIADALVMAHGQGIVHRDLKPANVIVTGTGVKLLDFGLAQLRKPDGAIAHGAAAVPGRRRDADERRDGVRHDPVHVPRAASRRESGYTQRCVRLWRAAARDVDGAAAVPR